MQDNVATAVFTDALELQGIEQLLFLFGRGAFPVAAGHGLQLSKHCL